MTLSNQNWRFNFGDGGVGGDGGGGGIMYFFFQI